MPSTWLLKVSTATASNSASFACGRTFAPRISSKDNAATCAGAMDPEHALRYMLRLRSSLAFVYMHGQVYTSVIKEQQQSVPVSVVSRFLRATLQYSPLRVLPALQM